MEKKEWMLQVAMKRMSTGNNSKNASNTAAGWLWGLGKGLVWFCSQIQAKNCPPPLSLSLVLF
jgi:hypothetical protein